MEDDNINAVSNTGSGESGENGTTGESGKRISSDTNGLSGPELLKDKLKKMNKKYYFKGKFPKPR